MKDIPLRILSIIEAPSAKTFRMKYYGKEEMPAFRAGQYFFASIGSGEEKTTLPCMISSAAVAARCRHWVPTCSA